VAGALADGAADADDEATGAAAARLVAAVGTGARDPGAAAGDCVHPRAPEASIETTNAEAHAFEMRQPIGGNSVRLLVIEHVITTDFSAVSSRSQTPIATSKGFRRRLAHSTESTAWLRCSATSHHLPLRFRRHQVDRRSDSDQSAGAYRNDGSEYKSPRHDPIRALDSCEDSRFVRSAPPGPLIT
jgi:hypothetical protein